MCHSSCATCSDESFTGCLSCTGTNILYQSVCYCSQPWSSDCTSDSSFQNIFRFFQSFIILSFILCIVLYCLKVKLPMTYRVLSGVQAMSLLIYSKTIYLDYEDFYILKLFNLLSGPHFIKYRLQTISSNYAIQTYVLIAFFLFLLFILYFPSKTFNSQRKQKPKQIADKKQNKQEQIQQQSFFRYLKTNVMEYLQNFYYFGGKMMFFYIGLFIQSKSTQLTSIVHMGIFCFLIFLVIVRLVYEYHQNTLSQEIFQGPLYLYSMLSNGAMIGIAMVSDKSMLLLIYCLPLGLLVLIVVLNKDFKIIEKGTLKFLGIEVLMIGLCVLIILMNDQMKTIIILITLLVSSIVIIVQLSMHYYSGINLVSNQTPRGSKGSNKVHPQHQKSQNDIENQSLKNQEESLLSRNKKKGKYF